ncbi:DUF4381 domain-containing protein [Microbulbifer salipaludis]|uniref:DUF4381 domain-containing protein n=1 Tax=Microbulbifer salipaludis TaxID=187980 RepID=A0ABS3E9S2_9GAMM|nr:DUF4381 domain-containing protein [Microbulbifer salipaludis]MBN8432063.1 DUF4381 domain-containing protein [Microbulbifer salipaludis]
MQGDTPPPTETTLPDLIAQLAPPPVPESVSLWPQTPLAQLLLGAVLLLCLYVAWRTYRHYRANAYRRAALKALRHAGDNPGDIAALLRRTALVAYPRAQVAGLTGERWLAFLNRQYPGDAFRNDIGESLLRGAYRSCPSNPALTQAAQDWIRHHRREILLAHTPVNHPKASPNTKASPNPEASP